MICDICSKIVKDEYMAKHIFMEHLEVLVDYYEGRPDLWEKVLAGITGYMAKTHEVEHNGRKVFVKMSLLPEVKKWEPEEAIGSVYGAVHTLLTNDKEAYLKVLAEIVENLCAPFLKEKVGGRNMPEFEQAGRPRQASLVDFEVDGFAGEGGFEKFMKILEEDGEAKFLEALAIEIAAENGYVTADDIRMFVENHRITLKKSYKVFGAVLRNLKDKEVLKIEGYVRSKIPSNHGRPIALYKLRAADKGVLTNLFMEE